jgi:hypothetical protein
MGLKFEAFFYFNKQGRRIERGITAALAKQWAGPAHKERENDNLFCCQTQGTFQKRTRLSMAKAQQLPTL